MCPKNLDTDFIFMHPVALGRNRQDNLIEENTHARNINKLQDPNLGIKFHSETNKSHTKVVTCLGF